jgi:large conductance mechanosensitive channel
MAISASSLAGSLGPAKRPATAEEEAWPMSILQEFKEFALRGNVVDMAVGIIIGGAFGTIVQSLVKDVIMPPIGMMLGGVDFSDIKIPLRASSAGQDAVTINIGTFFNNVISFLIVALAVFALIKGVNELRKRFEKEKEKPAAAPTPSELYLKEIRDALVKR